MSTTDQEWDAIVRRNFPDGPPDWAEKPLSRKTEMPTRIVTIPRALIFAGFLAGIWMLIFTQLAKADGIAPQPQNALTLDSTQTYVALIGALVPLATYVLNHYAPWVSEPAKAIFLVIVTAVAGGLYQALSSGGLGFNAATVQIIGTSIVSSLLAHKILWAPSGISKKLKAGTNAQVS